MWSTDFELDMLGPARERWLTMSFDDRVLLAFAFRDAMANPIRVGDYILSFHTLTSGQVATVHQFRFGFANFIVIDTCVRLAIYDFWLDDDRAMAAE